MASSAQTGEEFEEAPREEEVGAEVEADDAFGSADDAASSEEHEGGGGAGGNDDDDDDDLKGSRKGGSAAARPVVPVNPADAAVVKGREITFKTRKLNIFLTCWICKGYFRDATTINECLHTFCKSCLYKYLENNSKCPRCGQDMGANCKETLRSDRTLQSLVDKIFPELVKQDKDAERAFYAERGLKGGPGDEAPTPSIPSATTPSQKENKKLAAATDWMSFSLVPDDGSKKDLVELDKPFLQTSSKVTVLTLKKFLIKKLGLDAPSELDLTCKGEVLGKEFSLEFIAKTRWHDSDHDLVLTYRRAHPLL